jgi:hypothetical protein
VLLSPIMYGIRPSSHIMVPTGLGLIYIISHWELFCFTTVHFFSAKW